MTPSTVPTRRSRRRRVLPLAAAVVVAVALAGSANAGALGTHGDDSRAPKAASVKKQLRQLTKRIAALEQKKVPDSLPPSGQARGDLFGSYPNPVIAPNVVGPGKIPNESLTGFEIAPDSLYANDLATDSVGATELKGIQVRVSSGTAVPAGETRNAYAFCLAGEQVTGGGFAWQNDQAGTSIIGSTPDYSPAGHVWVVSGRAASANTLYAWALCLQP